MGMPLSLGADLSLDFTRRSAPMRNQNYWFIGNEPHAFPDGFSSYQEYVDNNRLPPSEFLMNYNQLYFSLGLSSGYRWTTYLGRLSLGGGTRIGLLRNSYESIFDPFDPVLRDSNDQWVPMNSLWLSLSLDQRDIFHDPSRGFYLLQRMGIHGILRDEREHYMRGDSRAQYFLTLFDIPVTDSWSFRSVLALNAGLSYVFSQPGSRELKIEEANKLAVDGMFNARGWSSAFRNKGLLLFDSWVELRFPLVRGILAFDLFGDAARVELDEGYYFTKENGDPNFFTLEDMLFSFGGGFRITLPQFPIRLSVVKRFTFDEDSNFEWVPGQIFRGDSKNGGVDFVISFVISY
jgi:outer membrane protein insertion porin family